jgi:hypothetical protein
MHGLEYKDKEDKAMNRESRPISWRQRMVQNEKIRKQLDQHFKYNLDNEDWRNKSFAFLRESGSIRIKKEA